MKNFKIVLAIVMCVSFAIAAPCAIAASEEKTTDTMSAAEKEKHKQHILDTETKTLADLYAKNSDAQKAVESAYGYAVFTNSGYNLAIFVLGAGHGVAFKNGDKTPIFMTMHKAGTGPGLGYTKTRQVITFANETLFDEFTTIGMQGQASANLTMKTDGSDANASMAMSLVPGVTFYQITDGGIDIQANWGGMMYRKDANLN